MKAKELFAELERHCESETEVFIRWCGRGITSDASISGITEATNGVLYLHLDRRLGIRDRRKYQDYRKWEDKHDIDTSGTDTGLKETVDDPEFQRQMSTQ